MKLSDEIRIGAPREKVFAALNDPEILKQAIPGCQALEQVSDTEMTATVQAKVGPVKAKFQGAVTLSDINAPESYVISGEGKGGAAGFAKGRATVSLSEDGDATLLTYDVDAEVGGKLAQVGGRLIEGASKKLAGEFFEAFSSLVGGDDKAVDDAPKVAETPAPTAAAPPAGDPPLLWGEIAVIGAIFFVPLLLR
ncbi:MAG: carbon monoxide dehydrogenase subunit G [Rhodospirillaceae bacterium]|nr:carbon monoxide dehydrogenase subunit G [Rhodospirillaceae bacterium]